MKLCPCHSSLAYEACCAPYHQGEAAPTAEALMRSRYSAYALHIADYIQRTATEKGSIESILEFCQNTSFEGLEILNVEEAEKVSFVTFKALLSQQGRDATFTEKSRFVKRDGVWLYEKAMTIDRAS